MWDEDEEDDGDEDGGQEEEGGYEGWVLRGGRPLHDAAGPGPGSMQVGRLAGLGMMELERQVQCACAGMRWHVAGRCKRAALV